MPRPTLLLTAAALTLGCMPAVTPGPITTPRASAGIAPLSAEDSIARLAAAWASAYATSDTIAAARILDDQFVSLAADGSSRTKPALLHTMSTGPRPEAGRVFETRVQRAGDVGIVLSTSWWGRRESDTQRGALYRTTDVFVRRPSGWRLMSEQVALVEPVHITPEDSVDAARALRQTLEFVRSSGRSRAEMDPNGGSTSAFAAGVPFRMDDGEVPARVLSIIDAPQSDYREARAPSREPFIPERLRLQMLSPDAAVATFELDRGDSIGRRTLVLRRNHGTWYLAHVHASSVPRVSSRPTPPNRVQHNPAADIRCESFSRSRPSAPFVFDPPASRRLAAPSEGQIVGILTDRITRARVGAASITVDRISSAVPEMPGQILQADSTGVFVAALPPGRYAVRAQRILYLPAADTVTVRTGVADTLRIQLRYHRCVGA